MSCSIAPDLSKTLCHCVVFYCLWDNICNFVLKDDILYPQIKLRKNCTISLIIVFGEMQVNNPTSSFKSLNGHFERQKPPSMHL